jgi:L-iditol 2-dehydrogenase
MIAAKYTQGDRLVFDDVPVPEISPDEILLKVDATSLCGTDVKIARHGHRKLKPAQSIVLGHEFVGTIEKLGKQVHGFSEGQRVGVAPNIGCGSCEMCARGLMNMCPEYSAFGINLDGSHTDYIRITAPAIVQGNVIPLSSSVSAVQASLAEPLSCAVNGIRVSRIEHGDTVLIYGAGPMGLMNLMLALISGAAEVFVIDLNDERLAMARSLGASRTFNSRHGTVTDWVMQQTGNRGVNVVITAVPAVEIQPEAIKLLAPFGRVCFFAGLPAGSPPTPLDTNLIHYRNLVVTGMTGGAPQDYRTAVRLIESQRIDVSRIISHVLPIHEVRKAYELALAGKGMKIVLAADASLASAPGS